MRKDSYFIFACVALLWWGCASPEPKPAVILKLDDLKFDAGLVHPGWQQVFEFLNAREVTATIGLIGESLVDAEPVYYNWIKGQHERGHEIWNHGYCHCKPTGENGEELREFRGTSLAYQTEQLARTQDLAREHLGFPLRTFGAPHNSTDSLTTAAVAAQPDLAGWMFKETATPTEARVFSRTEAVNIEYPVHVPNFEKFRAGYLANPQAPLLVIQGHPRSWVNEPERLEEFKKIVKFLIEEGVEFVTPDKYYAKP